MVGVTRHGQTPPQTCTKYLIPQYIPGTSYFGMQVVVCHFIVGAFQTRACGCAENNVGSMASKWVLTKTTAVQHERDTMVGLGSCPVEEPAHQGRNIIVGR